MEETKLLTLCLVEDTEGRVLLGMKKRDFGEGLWNGFGGEVREDESVMQAAARELQKESGIRGGELDEAGVLEFRFKSQPGVVREMHIFRVTKPVGEPRETEEMRPQWFTKEELPLEQMWPSDVKWIPLFMDGKEIKGQFLYDSSEKRHILEYKLDGELKEESPLREVRTGLKFR